ncbi:hypothetical protein [Arthrobacter mobilis]|uniref:Serine/threonine protein kinase n=1 Tax=Arthrobacter mobilis TaxID=2724944 RepID=A0A7X6K5X3_9MICC|nr:hypothetical protein [Arthrobacter mobilis]NKX53993.1 hypothetical protein [Arthrobacter mobilis]
MKKALAALAVAGLALPGSSAPAEAAPPANQLCPKWDSGRIDVSGKQGSVTIKAPAGKTIAAVCVKAGSAKQGLGAEVTYLDYAKKAVTVSHSSGKDISHYSVKYVPAYGYKS